MQQCPDEKPEAVDLMWKKSVASSPAAWVRRKVRQLVSASRGAGRILAAARIHRMVPAPTR
jgi:hypothetical protein